MKSEHIRVNIYAPRSMRNAFKYHSIQRGFNDMSEFIRFAVESFIAKQLSDTMHLNLYNIAAIKNTVAVIGDLNDEVSMLPEFYKDDLLNVINTLQAAVEKTKYEIEIN